MKPPILMTGYKHLASSDQATSLPSLQLLPTLTVSSPLSQFVAVFFIPHSPTNQSQHEWKLHANWLHFFHEALPILPIRHQIPCAVLYPSLPWQLSQSHRQKILELEYLSHQNRRKKLGTDCHLISPSSVFYWMLHKCEISSHSANASTYCCS
jgi:hypothetical protein